MKDKSSGTKLIHISDLHLGKRVNEFSMIDDQRYILKEILTIIKEEKADGVLIAGDIYDRSIPSEDAMLLWDEFLLSLAEMKMPVFVISGNHDSAVRLSDHAALISAGGIHIAGLYDGNASCVSLEDKEGKINIYMLPFIKPVQLRNLFPDEEINDYTDACRVAIEHMEIDTSERNVLMAHQFVTGATRCESEEITVGGLDNVDASVFDDFDYVALGHLHGKQKIKRDEVRYCGTPLKYSFSEKDHAKSVTVVELGSKGDVRISERLLTPLHDLREIRGTYEEVTDRKNYEGTAVDDYLKIVLTDENDIPEAIGKLRVIYKNLMKLEYDNARTRNREMMTDAEDVENKSPLELFAEFYEKQNSTPMTDEQRELVLECIESVWGDGS